MFVHISGDIRTGSRISPHCIEQDLLIRGLGDNLQFCGQCLMHRMCPFFNSIIAHLFEPRINNLTLTKQKGAFLS